MPSVTLSPLYQNFSFLFHHYFYSQLDSTSSSFSSVQIFACTKGAFGFLFLELAVPRLPPSSLSLTVVSSSSHRFNSDLGMETLNTGFLTTSHCKPESVCWFHTACTTFHSQGLLSTCHFQRQSLKGFGESDHSIIYETPSIPLHIRTDRATNNLEFLIFQYYFLNWLLTGSMILGFLS